MNCTETLLSCYQALLEVGNGIIIMEKRLNGLEYMNIFLVLLNTLLLSIIFADHLKKRKGKKEKT